MLDKCNKRKSNRDIPPLGSLRVFEAVARHGSLSKAAVELNVSRSAISQQIKTLESFVDSTLLTRTGNNIELTEQARFYLPIVTESLDNLHSGARQIFSEKEKGKITIRISHSFCYAWLLPRLSDFRRRFPLINFKFITTTRNYPEFSKDIDVEIINGYGNWDHPLTENISIKEQWIAVASPSFIRQYDCTQPIEILATYPKIQTYSYNESWKDWLHSILFGVPFTEPELQFDSTHLSMEAAIQGHGMLIAKSLLIEDSLKQGDLVQIHPKVLMSKSNHYLVSNPMTANRYEVDMFCKWLKAGIQAQHQLAS
ncbi:LysR family transcriptional regulator [Vibrio sp. E150_011]